MLIEYLPILLFIIAALLFAGGSVLLSALMGSKRPLPEKLEPYECGMALVGSARERFSVKFYVVAMLFIIFDIEIIFLYPWAVIYQELGWFGFFEMGGFLLVLALGLACVWRKGGLEWGQPEHGALRTEHQQSRVERGVGGDKMTRAFP
ncbi:MAG: NADH-quinone oxidoreductase subunit A [Candidatus Methylomirabilales bacterium]